jgi:hypothetical protein
MLISIKAEHLYAFSQHKLFILNLQKTGTNIETHTLIYSGGAKLAPHGEEKG